MAHIAPTSHRGKPASHRSTVADGPIQITTWLGLTFGLVLGLILTTLSHVGVRAAGFTLLIMLIPLTIAVVLVGLRRDLGSRRAVLATAAALTLVILRLALLA